MTGFVFFSSTAALVRDAKAAERRFLAAVDVATPRGAAVVSAKAVGQRPLDTIRHLAVTKAAVADAVTAKLHDLVTILD